ncbi:MAG: transporter substrate-binding domain-containing protein [Lactobacillales bacterium]|jgi:ABC-type amino acid transport substrate-binding protein|nr:transporter substrate-binding domain-containing protein [Lactobacillales bacterium]
MKKIVFFLFVCLFCFTGEVFAQRKQTRFAEEEVQTKTKGRQKAPFSCGYEQAIRVGGFVTNPPFGWVDVIPSDYGSAQDVYVNDGYAYRTFEQMTKDMGLKIKNVGFKSYHDALNALKKGDIDVLTGTYYDSRTLGVGTTLLYPSYFANPVIVFFKKGKEKDIKTFADLKGMKGVIRQEELLYTLIWRNLPQGLDLKQVAGARRAWTMLMTGEADFLIGSAYAGEAEIRRFKLMDDVVSTQNILVAPELFYVFASNSGCTKLIPQYEEELKKIKADEAAVLQNLIHYIDEWGLRFAANESLMEELAPKETPAPQRPAPAGKPITEE